MAFSLTGSRLLATQTETITPSLAAETPVEDSGADSVRNRVTYQDVLPDSFSVSITTTDTTPTITGADLSRLRAGDEIACANITGTITAVNTAVSPNTATIDANATASGTLSATVTPPQFDVALYDLVTTHTMNADSSVIRVALRVYRYDGSTANDANADGKDDTTPSAPFLLQEFNFDLDVDTILANARLPRN